MDRRSFVTAMSAAVGAGRVPGFAAGDPLLKRAGLQLYTVRDLVMQDMERTLDQVAAIGYEEVEFAGYFGHEPKAIRAMLDRCGLKAPAAHVSEKLLTGLPGGFKSGEASRFILRAIDRELDEA